MDDLISRQDAINAIKSMMTNLKYGKSEREALDDAQNLMYHMPSARPTADVVEVVHGEWIDKGEDYMIRWTCSNCGRRDTHIYNFCPDCGADMRGGTE